MYVSKKNNISIWNNDRSSYHSEKTQLPPPPPVPPHHTPPSSTTTMHSPSSQLLRCASMPHTAKTTTTTLSDPNTTTTTPVPARPMSWHPIPSRRSSRICYDDPEIKAKLDRIAQSDRILTLRTRLMHS